MKSTGEVMAIGRCFEEAFLKAWSSLETGEPHPRPLTRADESDGEGMAERANEQLSDSTLVEWLSIATDKRMGALYEAFRRGWPIERVHEITRMTRWFLYRFQNLARAEASIVEHFGSIGSIDAHSMRQWKQLGFTDAHIADAKAGFLLL
jgi:carbamoyl-phosphate synthase large subunit